MLAKIALTVALGIGLAGCGTGGVSLLQGAITTPTPPIQHAYVTDQINNAILIYSLPLSSSSSPVATIPVPGPGGPDCADSQGRLFFADGSGFTGGPIYAFAQPITSASKPSFTLPNAFAVACAADPAGNLYVGGIGRIPIDIATIDAYNAPVGAGSTPVLQYAPISEPFGVATDANGDVFAVCSNCGLIELSPRASGNKLLATFGTDTAGNVAYVGLAVGPDGNLYAAAQLEPGGVGTNGIDVYPPSSFRNGGVKAHTISLGNAPFYLAFDRVGNMIVVVSGTGGTSLYTIPPPYTSPSVITPTTAGAYGIAIAP